MLYNELASMEIMESMEQNADYVAISTEDCSTLLAVYLQESVGSDTIEDALAELNDSVLESSYNYGYDEVMERTIVKLDKKAKKNQAYKTAIYTVARNENDPDYKKLVTLWQMEKYLTRKLEKKYATKAKSYLREMKRQAKEKSKIVKFKDHPIVKTMTSALTRSEKETQKAKKLSAPPKGVMSKGKNIMSQLGSKVG